MSRHQPKYRRPLNHQQLAILSQLYRFRFVNTKLLTNRPAKVAQVNIHQRLSRLLDQAYLERTYSTLDRQTNTPAVYSLSRQGLSAVAAARGWPRPNFRVYDQARTTPATIARQLATPDLANQLGRLWSGCQPLTRLELRSAGGYPAQLPDLQIKAGRQCYLVELIDDSRPAFSLRQRLSRYQAYFDSGEWPLAGEALPSLVLVGSSSPTAAKVRRLVIGLLDELDPALAIYATSLKSLQLAETARQWLGPNLNQLDSYL